MESDNSNCDFSLHPIDPDNLSDYAKSNEFKQSIKNRKLRTQKKKY